MTTESDRPLTQPVRGVDRGDAYRISVDELGHVNGILHASALRNNGMESYFDQFRTNRVSGRESVGATSAVTTSGSALTLADLESTVGIIADRVAITNPYITSGMSTAAFAQPNALPDLIASLSIEKSGDLYKTRMMLKGEPSNIVFLSDSIRAAMLEAASILISKKLASDY